jgi:hypothetical protein
VKPLARDRTSRRQGQAGDKDKADDTAPSYAQRRVAVTGVATNLGAAGAAVRRGACHQHPPSGWSSTRAGSSPNRPPPSACSTESTTRAPSSCRGRWAEYAYTATPPASVEERSRTERQPAVLTKALTAGRRFDRPRTSAERRSIDVCDGRALCYDRSVVGVPSSTPRPAASPTSEVFRARTQGGESCSTG